MSVFGGTPPRRPDQQTDQPAAVLAPGGATGIFRGRLVIVKGGAPPASGIFVYDVSGNLVGAWVGRAGTDPVNGTAVAAGLTVQNSSGTLQSVLSGGSLTVTKLSGVLAPPHVQVADDTVNSGATGSNVTSVSVNTSLVQTYDPVLLDGTIETWHNFGTIAAGWSVGNRSRYKLMPDNMVAIDMCNIHPPGSAPVDGTVIYTAGNGLPAAYRPASSTFRVVIYASTIGTEAPAFSFNSDGTIAVYGVGGVNPSRLDCLTQFPLD